MKPEILKEKKCMLKRMKKAVSLTLALLILMATIAVWVAAAEMNTGTNAATTCKP